MLLYERYNNRRRQTSLSFAVFEILRFAQNDKVCRLGSERQNESMTKYALLFFALFSVLCTLFSTS